jgi:protein involved in polysaccharide export with SLBB domain
MNNRLASLSLLLLSLPALHAETHHKYPPPPPEFFQANNVSGPVLIGPGDVLAIGFFYNPEMNQEVTVRRDGKVSLYLSQGLQVAGETPEQLQAQLVTLYSHELKNPEISVQLKSSANSSIYVTGEVRQPGVQVLRGKLTVAMALAASQMSQKTAGTKSVFLIRSMGEDKFTAYKLDATFPGGNATGVYLMPGDVLFVPRKAIVKADDFMDLYIRELLPATPSASATVLFTPGNPVASSTAAATQ